VGLCSLRKTRAGWGVLMSISTPIQSVSSASDKSIVTIALCFAVAILEGFDIQALGVAAPKLAPELGLAPNQMGWVFSVSNIGLIVGAAVGGGLADRFGRKPIFIASVLTFGLFTLLTPLVQTFTHLFALRLLAGLGFGAALPNMMAIAAEISPPHKRASTAATMFCGMPLGGGTSALLTQLLPPDFDWRTLFIVGGALPLVLAPAMMLWMRETLQRSSQVKTQRTDLFEALFADGRATPTLLLWLAFLPTLIVLYLILNWLPTLAIANGLDRATAPQASLAFNFASVLGALVIGRVVDRWGARGPLTLAYAVLIGALLALANAHDLGTILLYSAAAGFFLMGANYALYGVAAAYYPQRMRGTGSGASIAVGRIGSIIGPLSAGFLLSSGTSAATLVVYLVPAAAIAGVAVFALGFFKADPSNA
jgi:MFS transporter, AAHS family, 3-hydroxyphenylpropionic acid transporter